MNRTTRTIVATLAAGCLLASAAAAAGPVPAGPTFHLSDCTDCQQHQPMVAGSPAGNFVTVWTGAPPQVVEQGVFGRGFKAAGTPAAAPFAVVQDPQPPQYDAAVATDVDGNFILAWGATGNGQNSILAQRVDPTGAPLGPVIKVVSDPSSSPDTPANQKPSVAATSDGGFYVAWIALPDAAAPGGTPPRVLAQRFDAVGVPVRGQIQLSTGLVLGDRPSICVDQRGRLIAAWTFVDAFRPFQASKIGVAARRLRPRGGPLGGEIIIDQASARTAAVALSCGRSNSFVVTWHRNDDFVPDVVDVVAQIWTGAGRPASPPFVVEGNAPINLNPSVAHDPAGNFVIASEFRDGDFVGISAFRVAPDGRSKSPEVKLLTTAPRSGFARPAVGTLGTQEFVVVWEGLDALYGQRYSVSP